MKKAYFENNFQENFKKFQIWYLFRNYESHTFMKVGHTQIIKYRSKTV